MSLIEKKIGNRATLIVLYGFDKKKKKMFVCRL